MPRAALRLETSLQGRLKLARLLSMPEEEAAKLAREIETDPLYARLVAAGAVRRPRFPAAAFSARRLAGRSLVSPESALGELLDGRSDLVELMRRVGPELLRDCFLESERMSDAERARRCGLSEEEAATLRQWLDRLYIRTEFEPRAAAPAEVFSTVAGIGIRAGRPELRFFRRDIWSGAYEVDEARLGAFNSASDPRVRARAHRLIERMRRLDRRKTALYRALEALLDAQADYLKSGDPARRQPMTQRSLALAIGVETSALNRLISNKAIELPWGSEAPIACLLPSAKTLARERLGALARKRPEATDEALRRELAERHHVYLSRRSVAQYRLELGLRRRGRKA
jgi:hypothetical protein